MMTAVQICLQINGNKIKEEINKLLTVESGAEKNIINAVSEEFSIDEIERKLSLHVIDGKKIINLMNNTDFSGVYSDVNNIKSQLNDINSSITGMYSKFVLKETYDNDMSNVWHRLTWHEL